MVIKIDQNFKSNILIKWPSNAIIYWDNDNEKFYKIYLGNLGTVKCPV